MNLFKHAAIASAAALACSAFAGEPEARRWIDQELQPSARCAPHLNAEGDPKEGLDHKAAPRKQLVNETPPR